MQDSDRLFMILFSLAAGVGGLWFFFHNHFRARLMENLSTSKVRSAAQGYVELKGFARLMVGEPIVSPLTKTRCCWWRYKIESKDSDGDWRVHESGSSDELFLLEDDTGLCVVDPEGASVTPWGSHSWYGNERHPQSGRIPAQAGLMGKVMVAASRYRYTEEFIYEDNPLYAVGHFHTMGELDHREGRQELMREILRKWKAQPAQLRARFDRNGDGQVDQAEWEEARKLAAVQARKEHDEIERNLVPHMLSRPAEKGQPFILATKDQDELAGALRLWGYGALLLGLSGIAVALFLIFSLGPVSV
jgi:hypothetical protein